MIMLFWLLYAEKRHERRLRRIPALYKFPLLLLLLSYKSLILTRIKGILCDLE